MRMIGFDVSSSERYSGPIKVEINFGSQANAEAIAFAKDRVEVFGEAIKAGFFFPGMLRGYTWDTVRVEAGSLRCEFEVVDLTATAFAVLGGLLMDCRHHEVPFRSAHAILGTNLQDLLVETGLRPEAANRPPFTVDFPQERDGNYALLVEIEFANSVESAPAEAMIDMLALWEVLSLAYPLDPDDPVEVCGAQIFFNDPRTIHHEESIWENADPVAWNLLVNLCCAWNRTLPIVRLHVE
jgi:hypothetical protein